MYYLFSKNKSMADLVDQLKKKGIIKSKTIEKAFLSVDRKDFYPLSDKSLIYMDGAQSIGYKATISAPHMHAYALELLQPALKSGSKCLDIGSGSGIFCALMARVVGPTGKVIGVEHIPKLVEQSITNLKKSFNDEYDKGIIKIIEGDGRLGYESEAPYDCIHVGAAMKSIDDNIVNQLANNGIMVAPVDNGFGYQEITVVKKDANGEITKDKVVDVRYVPLTSKEKQCPGMFK